MVIVAGEDRRAVAKVLATARLDADGRFQIQVGSRGFEDRLTYLVVEGSEPGVRLATVVGARAADQDPVGPPWSVLGRIILRFQRSHSQ